MLRLRSYVASDRAACVRLLESNVPEYFLASDAAELAAFLDGVERMGVRYFVIEAIGAAPFACGGVALVEGDARMCWGIVDRLHHRRGLGRLLLAFRVVAAARMGAKTASLATIPAAEGFFAREGFGLTAAEDDHYAKGMHRRDYAISLDRDTVLGFERRLEELARARVEIAAPLSP